MRRLLLPLAAVCLLCQPALTRAALPSVAESKLSRGRYLTLAANCASCHTTTGGQLFAGGLGFETAFGKIYSTNISPDAKSGIGAWTEQQFRRALREGIRADGEHLYPVFPYTEFTKISDEDASAIFAYLKSVPAQRATAPPNEMSFPFNQRSLMGIWNAMFLRSGAYRDDAARSPEWNRGAYLVNALAHCSACHTPRNTLGAERSTQFMAGGVLGSEVASGDVRTWSAPNLTSAPAGLGAWSLPETVAYLKTGKNTFVTTFGPMNEVIQNSLRHLDNADVQAMALYLKDLPPYDPDSPGAATAETLRLGRILYNVYCGTCHLPTGLGSADNAARLAGGSLLVKSGNPASLINVILYGPQVPQPPVPDNKWKTMEAFGDRLSDADVAALATFVMNSWNNQGGEVTVKQVAQQRQSEVP